MKSRSKAFELPEHVVASSSITNSDRLGQTTAYRNSKLDLNTSSTPPVDGLNKHVNNKSKSAPILYEVPLDTPSACQNYSGSILDPSTNNTQTITLKCKQKFRFFICLLAIFSFSICLASRMALNIAINQICSESPADMSDETIGGLMRFRSRGIIPMHEDIEHRDHDRVYETKHNQLVPGRPKASKTKIKYETVMHIVSTNMPKFRSDDNETTTSASTTTSTTIEPSKPSVKPACQSETRQYLMGAFYLGYFPIMLISGYLAEKYGAKTALFLAVFGSGTINMATPYTVEFVLPMILLRVLLGALQAPVVPALYALCNVWLSKTEMGIFASFIKVSMGLGVLFGYSIPGTINTLGYHWGNYFYTEASICLVWSIVWLFLATSKPQDNTFVQLDELRWISRKKPVDLALIENGTSQQDNSPETEKQDKAADHSIIYCMLKHPSVWALAVTKLTHNIAIDFVLIEFPSFMDLAHGQTLDKIVIVACTGALTIALLVSLVGWLSKIVVQRQIFGLTKTISRKVFQGIANFGVSALFFIMASVWIENLYILTLMVVLLNVFYMFGSGGEAVAANDMSNRYPATIYGFAHSISALDGLMVPGLAALVLGDEPKKEENWKIYFFILGSLSAFGGFVFIFIFKSKLFLPSEILEAEKQLEKLPITRNTRSNK